MALQQLLGFCCVVENNTSMSCRVENFSSIICCQVVHATVNVFVETQNPLQVLELDRFITLLERSGRHSYLHRHTNRNLKVKDE